MVKKNTTRSTNTAIHSKKVSRSLLVEQLERRCVLAGNVFASVAGGVLTLRGDDLGNVIGVTQPGSNTVQVTGVGTTINGSAQPATFSGVTSIFADLRGGDDSLGISRNTPVLTQLLTEIAKPNPSIPNYSTAERFVLSGGIQVIGGNGNDSFGVVGSIGRNVFTDMGAGNDRVGVLSSALGAEITAIAGDGADTVLVQNSEVKAHIRIDTGRNDDVIRVVNVSANSVSLEGGEGNDQVVVSGATIVNSLVATTGLGNDNVSIQNVSAVDIVADTADGNDILNVSRIRLRGSAVLVTGAGDDGLYVDVNGNSGSVIARDLIANAGPGANTIGIGSTPLVAAPVVAGSATATSAYGNIVAIGGERTDSISLLNVAGARNITVDSSSGDDQVRLDNVAAIDQIFVQLAGGNDTLSIGRTRTKNAVFLGGAGTDRYIAGAGNSFQRLERREFEIV